MCLLKLVWPDSPLHDGCSKIWSKAPCLYPFLFTASLKEYIIHSIQYRQVDGNDMQTIHQPESNVIYHLHCDCHQTLPREHKFIISHLIDFQLKFNV
jgi:hypothetical protein